MATLGVVVDPITGATIDLSRASPIEAATYAAHVGQQRRATAANNAANLSDGVDQVTSGQPVEGAPEGTGQTTHTDATSQVVDPITRESIDLSTASPEKVAQFKANQAATGRHVWDPLSSATHVISSAAGAAGQAASDGASDIVDAFNRLASGLASGGGDGGNVDTAPISAAAANAKALSDKFLSDYNAAHPGEPPVATAAQLPPAVLAAMPPAIKAGIAAQGSPVQAGTATASLIDPSTGLQFRQGQEGLIQTLNDAISGKAPSVAELQMKRALETNSANQLGLASKASGGGNTFLALQAAANNIGHLNQGASSDAALLRAKEIMDARGQLGGVLDQARGGDITIGKTNAELGTGVSTTNANNTTSANSETARLANAIATSNAGNETSANVATGNIVRDILQGNQKAAQDTNLTQGKFATDTNIANAKGITDQRAIDEKTKADLASSALTGSGQQITGTVGAAQAAATAAAAKAQADAAKLGAVGAGAATLLPYIFGKPK